MKKLFYFGCGSGPGHYFFGGKGSYSRSIAEELPGINCKVLDNIDGAYPPGGPEKEGIYLESIVPPVRIVSWWDRSVDSRPGSNSNLIGYGYGSAEEMLDDAVRLYPWVMKRHPRPTPKKEDKA
jgi:hypothetical protein